MDEIKDRNNSDKDSKNLHYVVERCIRIEGIGYPREK
jgi:hypothetical protein